MSQGQNLSKKLTSFIAVIVGLTTLLSLLLGNNPELFAGVGEQADTLAQGLGLPATIFVRLTMLIIAVTIVIGIINLLWIHIKRTRHGARYSLILILSFGGTIAWYIFTQGDTTLLKTIQLPIESSFAGLLFFSLVYGGARIMQIRPNRWGILFVVSMLVALIGTLPFAGIAPLKSLIDPFVSGGARGILLGIALATVVTGIRVLFGHDRSYRG